MNAKSLHPVSYISFGFFHWIYIFDVDQDTTDFSLSFY